MSEEQQNWDFETRAIHAGAQPDPATGARSVPIYQTTSFVFNDPDHAAALFNLQEFGFIYTRIGNPTVSALEERVASLEGGRAAVACASGHSAQLLTFFTLLEPGDHVVAAQYLYGGSINQFNHMFPRFSWTKTFVDPHDIDAVKAAVTDKTKALFCESVSNPSASVTDLEAWARVAEEARIPLVVDNTMATPYLCRPFEWGADIIVHSLTKFLSGHGTSMGGIVVESGKFDWSQSGKFPYMTQPDPAYHGLSFYETFGDFAFSVKVRAVGLRDLGPALSPTNAFYILTGMETLPLRMERHVANARELSGWLARHPKVSWVAHPELESSPERARANKYIPRGGGSIFTFGVVGGYDMGRKVVERCQIFSHLANVGDTRSLIIHPASTTHRQLSEEQLVAAGAGPDVVRLSVGLESSKDLIADLDQALAGA
ncbi:MAG: O-acetylhomoserine aminocarboxypropyltransferase [Myxococcota bacterium]